MIRLRSAAPREGENLATLIRRVGSLWSAEQTAIANGIEVHSRLERGWQAAAPRDVPRFSRLMEAVTRQARMVRVLSIGGVRNRTPVGRRDRPLDAQARDFSTNVPPRQIWRRVCVPEQPGGNNVMKLALSILVVALVSIAFASTASAHVVMVTAAIPAATAADDSDLDQALAVVLDDAITRTVAFEPTQITLAGVRRVGDQIYLLLLIVDADGEQLMQRLESDDRASSRSPAGRREQPARPTM